ncbi:MAG: HAD family phosphatase [Candidatus Omnitrophica bacterium]|nr:HAD family phosphatase [Candidatus Omnitrophota bacterium]
MDKDICRVKAVIFDMDGVITNTMPDHYRAWQKVLRLNNIHVTYHDIYSREGQPGEEALREIYQKYKIPYKKEEGMKILSAKEDYFKLNVKQRFISGARTLLKKLHKNDLKLALVTGTARREMERILPKSLYDLFSVIVTGNDIKFGKPHPEPFNKAVEYLGIKKQEAVVIENAPYGIQSAKAAGLKCFALETSLPREYLSQADAIFDSIKDLNDNIIFDSL